eukprot:TRINITY_DN5469_c0_g1_i3.p1 TRINITY_DN5469_c0_g1~~TRINITY_DN5469_c0_g1_i3.p1  ORF type:complete len:4660 (-),score=1275.41 TRINITY_DN5469_c0_g1_i3:88-14067(-)
MLSPRLSWIAENVASAFGREEHIKQVEGTILESLNFKKLNEFLEGKTKQQHIFFFYQRPDAYNDQNELIDAGKDVKLTITTGENERIKSFAVYFLRNVPPEKAIRSDVASDQDLLFGEVTPNPLESLSATLSDVFRPLAARSQEANWGQCDDEQKADFLASFEKFTLELSEAIAALNGGIVLNKDLPMGMVLDPNTPQYQEVIKENPEVIGEYGHLLEVWCREIERYLEEGLDQQKEVQEPGPRSELEFWRGRMQKITSITEQLKGRECKAVFNVLHAVTRQQGTGDVAPKSRQTVFNTLRRWKQIDISITEAFNEAKDNVKYLTTLEKFIEPLYSGAPNQIIDTLPALMNSVKMIHTIARYYNTSERMTNLFAKITNQMITNCKACIIGDDDDVAALWEKSPPELIKNLELCLKMNAAFQEQYRITKDKLLTLPKGKQFDFSETLIFGRFDLFCRRVVKLINMFSTIHQFQKLKIHLKSMDGIHQLVGAFQSIVDDFKTKRHDLLDFLNNRFDRDYVEFNVRISELESALQEFINQSFQNIASIDTSLKLLGKFQSILQHGTSSLRTDLESKFGVILHNYGQELEALKDLYEKNKNTPHIVRNMPPVAGNIMWARHLLHRIMDPMQKLHSNPLVLAGGKESKRIIRLYNKMVKTLVEFEIVWHQAWVNSIDATKAGLSATLIVKLAEDNKHHVNFDPEILQLIRETRCLDRMGNVEIPESARMLLLQEEKFKAYYNELNHLLREYRRVTQLVRPICAHLLKPHLDHLEFQLRPGMVSLTWTSMNIDTYLKSVWTSLDELEQLVLGVNDIMESRVDANLRDVSHVLLADLPEDNRLVSLDDFVDIQERHVRQTTDWLVAKNTEIEAAVNDMLGAIVSFPLDPHVRGVSESEIIKVKAHYNWSMYQSLLAATKRSLHKVKERLSARLLADGSQPPAFFEVELQLNGLGVCLHPSIEDIQNAISGGAVAVLKCSKMIEAWDTVTIPRNVQLLLNPNLPPVRGTGSQGTFYDRVAQDKEILKVVLLLTGSIQSARNGRDEYLQQFDCWSWLWSSNIAEEYRKFRESEPTLDEFEAKLRSFARLDDEFLLLEPRRQISALSLQAGGLTRSLRELAGRWKESFARELHTQAFQRLESLSEVIKTTKEKLSHEVADGDIDALGHMMRTLREVREKQGEIEWEMEPIVHMYAILDSYLPNILDKEEQDARSMLQSGWARLLAESETRQLELTVKQVQFKRNLIKTVHSFKRDVEKFRRDYEERGPMVKGIRPSQAVERLRRCKEEYEVHGRKQQIFALGETLFGLPHQRYVQLDATKKELEYLSQLYELYSAVLDTIGAWKDYLWVDVPGEAENMKKEADQFANRCKKMPKQLRQWPAYHELKKEIEDFQEVLPLLMELSKKSIQGRHWQQVNDITGKDLQVEREDFKLQSLIDAKLNDYKDDILDITESADKQQVIEERLGEITAQWSAMAFEFSNWKAREVPCILVGGKVNEVQESLEETQMVLNAMNAQRHSAPFKEELMALITTLSDTADTIERWFKVQQMWTSLESVFTGGDIAKQMPMEAKKFSQIDKDWLKIMHKSAETLRVVDCCQNDLLRQMMPVLLAGLETCQKSLESYLEGKRQKFPRFYFTSDPVLLKILSQGSDPETIQDDFEKLFDAISRVTFHKLDRRKITEIKSVAGQSQEVVVLQSPVMAQGNIEDWLHQLELEMQRSVRRECRLASMECGSVNNGTSIRSFADKYIAQVALLGIQLIWTNDFQAALSTMSREKDKSVMSATNRKFLQLLSELIQVCLQGDLTKLDRIKYETLVTIHVHQKDLFQEVMKKPKDQKVKDENDFEWLKQTRMYWRSENDHAVISIADVDFIYSYEYLGCKERLVITALTDRCYLTQSQALGMFFGGAPAGPAGTGKTETTKDMGRTLGIFVVVTNCSDQHRFKDMAKIFKGLCMSGLWGCFDEFNRIELEVLSVVATQVESIMQAKKQNSKTFPFPGEPFPIKLVPSVGYFITMNPGYAGRQELPENLKVLFRSVSMMVPNRETIMKVKLASVGYSMMDILGKKFNMLYALCEQQLSKQRHYDFGLRNILSVLRQSGAVKRAEATDTDEEMLFMRTVRDMNLSKLVADDVPLFLALLRDLFPKVTDPPKKTYDSLEATARKLAAKERLVEKETWMLKVIQLYETSLVRHGFMLVGPTLCGKSRIMQLLTTSMTEDPEKPVPHRLVVMNPKAITDAQMYGVKDVASDEWTPGVFASIWQQRNNRALKYNTWIVCDGPIDAIWIENLNTVLDDNKILTLANNDRIPMTDNCRIVFEVESLINASPATVSRAGIIYVSIPDLGWEPIVESWLQQRLDMGSNRQLEVDVFRPVIDAWLKTAPPDGGAAVDFFDWNNRNLKTVMPVNDSIRISNVLNLLSACLRMHVVSNEVLPEAACLRVLVYCMAWGIGGLLEPEGRRMFHAKLCEIITAAGNSDALPPCQEGETIFEYVPDPADRSRPWKMWAPSEWKVPKQLRFSALLIPTVDSCRAEYMMKVTAKLDMTKSPANYKSTLLVGSAGTAKTSTAMMFLQKYSMDTMLSKRINFSSATNPLGLQRNIEGEVERKTGKTFCPPGGKQLTVFLDDASMPLVNKWGDQVTNELTRQLMEFSGFYFLDRDKRGEFKKIENLQYVAAMGHPGGGRNDIPNRLKSKFLVFNMVLPSTVSADNIYGNILRARFTAKQGVDAGIIALTRELTSATIAIWTKVQKSLLPTPARFHYIFNMRELSRVFQGIMETPLTVVTNEERMVGLWRHENTRVFADKLSRQQDKTFIDKCVHEVAVECFGESLAGRTAPTQWWCDFQRDKEAPSEEDEDPVAPKIYEPVESMPNVCKKAYEYLSAFNEKNQAKAMNLVLFEDAMMHLMRINRTIQQKRGSAMLVGVGGSGKQSLTRLAAFISNHYLFQITITKTYSDLQFLEDLKELYIRAGQKNEDVTFIFTDQDVKNENFLEYMNSILATGEVVGLLQKDEKETCCNEVRNDYVKDNPGGEENPVNLYAYFLDRLRDNLHIVLAFSPLHAKFAVRAQMFPAVFSAVNINWFMPWPEAALVAVSANFLGNYKIDTTDEHRQCLYELMGSFQKTVRDVCAVYLSRMRKHVYVTPRSFLCFIDYYKKLYTMKYEEVNVQEKSVNIGLQKLAEAAVYVEKMKVDIVEQEKVLKVEDEKTNKLLIKVQGEKVKAEKKAEEVGRIKKDCEDNAAAIGADKEEANRELNAALPFLHEANAACNAIRDKDIVELKQTKNPVDIVRLTFDGLLLLQGLKISEVKPEDKTINKVQATFMKDSFEDYSKGMISDINFLKNLKYFAENERDQINDETCELIEPYLRFDQDPAKNWSPWKHPVLEQALARKANVAAEGLCKFVGAMVMYHQASKIVKPKMDYLKVQEAKLDKARQELAAAEAELAKVQSEVDELDRQLQEAFAAKAALEANALAMKKRMDAANRLLNGLSGENDRWTEDAKNFATRRLRLVGDVALACGFVTYCGPFNSEFRDKISFDLFLTDVHKRKVPANERVNLVEFLVDEGTIGEWSLEGLPNDDLSIQNAIMVTRSSRYPLMIDPQGQALFWIKKREDERISREPLMCVTTLGNKMLKEQVEHTMTQGLCLIIENVENEVDPLLDPVLEKAVVKKGPKKFVIRVGDANVDFDWDFTLYMTSRLPNPHFSPELSAKTTVIDFTVTLRGLEQQLLGRVLNMEQRSLEEMLAALKEEATNNTKSLQLLGKQLLDRLSNAEGNLLDDTQLIEVLANTKAKAKEVEGKLEEARQRTIEIDEKREQFRTVATRGSIMYFNMTDMILVSNPITLQPSGWMYNCSLDQFLEQFDFSIRNSEKVQPTSKRVDKIIDFLTYKAYRYMNRGLFERDKMMFKLMVTLKIMTVGGSLTNGDVLLFLKAGSSLDKNAERSCPFRWMGDKAWLNAIQLTRHSFGHEQLPLFRDLTELLQRNEVGWRKWFDENEPENCPVPEYEERITSERTLGSFVRLVLVRALREDRTGIATVQFINKQLGPKFTAPVSDTITEIYQESGARKPVLYLLSAGTDPTSMIDELAKKRKKFPTDKVSMGEGQEKVAREKNNAAFITGGWVILQNCHLGIDYMNEVEDTLVKTSEIDPDYRLWITCEITSRFPIGLLQMMIKVTLEPPAGLKASLYRTYTTMITQETLDKVDHEKWRMLLYVMAVLHSIVQERRKFGPIGWCIPYEFNNSDLDASLLFLEKHLSSTVTVGLPLSWITIQYMVAEVQYGGRITDDLDREQFVTYAAKWLCDDIYKPSFTFNNYHWDFNYQIPDGLEMAVYREYIDEIPSFDSPLIFGLHPNADITYRLKEASEMLTTIIETQPKEGGAGDGKSVDEIVKEQALELLDRMPPDFVEEVFRAQIMKLRGPPKLEERGFGAPLNIFLFQELQRLQNIVSIVRSNLQNLSMAIDGTVVMTVDLLEDLNSVFDGRVPKRWTHDASGAEISWLLPNIGGWFTGLLDRYHQLNTWLENGRKEMKSYWITGFTNAQGFLTGIRQEVTRQHKKDQWALDDVVAHTEVLTLDTPERIRELPEEGQNIHGLYIEGARWNRLEGKLDESEPKKLQAPMPVIYVSAMTVQALKAQGLSYGSFPPFNAAVYKYPRRNDRYLIFRLLLKAGEHHPHHWRLRGVCLVAQMD